MGLLAMTLKNGSYSFGMFAMMFFVVFFAYAQFFYFIYHTNLQNFYTVVASAETCMQVLWFNKEWYMPYNRSEMLALLEVRTFYASRLGNFVFCSHCTNVRAKLTIFFITATLFSLSTRKK